MEVGDEHQVRLREAFTPTIKKITHEYALARPVARDRAGENDRGEPAGLPFDPADVTAGWRLARRKTYEHDTTRR
jgi:hypothetical protein